MKGLHHKCGVLGIQVSGAFYADLLTSGLHALQHRGQESFGVSIVSEGVIHRNYEKGLVQSTSIHRFCKDLPVEQAIGHVRYATSGRAEQDKQPILFSSTEGQFSIAHNGHFVNAEALRQTLEKKHHCHFTTTMDTEVLGQLIRVSQKKFFIQQIREALEQIVGGYALLMMDAQVLIGIRDPNGIRPLILGYLPEKGYVLASESCALVALGAEVVRDVNPGEAIILQHHAYESIQLLEAKPRRHCVFEYIYFARPDSVIDALPVYLFRKSLGRLLSQKRPVVADIVLPVPESSWAAAIGFSEASGIPLEMGIVRNPYAIRSFIQPDHESRLAILRRKHSINQAAVRGKDVVVVDDSLVRGNTLKHLVALLRRSSVRSIHLRIASPMVKYSCFYGIDTPDPKELLANKLSHQEMRRFFDVESVYFLTVEDLRDRLKDWVSKEERRDFCDACFSGEYPTVIE